MPYRFSCSPDDGDVGSCAVWGPDPDGEPNTVEDCESVSVAARLLGGAELTFCFIRYQGLPATRWLPRQHSAGQCTKHLGHQREDFNRSLHSKEHEVRSHRILTTHKSAGRSRVRRCHPPSKRASSDTTSRIQRQQYPYYPPGCRRTFEGLRACCHGSHSLCDTS